MAKKPALDVKACSTCDSYKPVEIDCGECHLMPPQWIDDDGDAGWSRPVTNADSACRFWLRRLNS